MFYFGSVFVLFVLVSIIAGMKYKDMRKDEERKAENERAIRTQILNWCNNGFEPVAYKPTSMVSPAKMKNGEINLEGMEITFTDYTKNVRWIIRK